MACNQLHDVTNYRLTYSQWVRMSKEIFRALLDASPFKYTFPLAKLTEDDFDGIFEKVGGVRIAEGSDNTADYRIENAVLELKFLEAEGVHSPIRQKKLAELFRPTQPDRPVVVLDDGLLDNEETHTYRQIYKGTIQSHIRKAKKQLKKSRLAHPDTEISILFFHNIGFSSMSQDDLLELIKVRVRNDASSIDGVAVSGSYTISDGFNGQAFMHFQYEPLSDLGEGFQSTMDGIHSALFAQQMMGVNSAIRGEVETSDASDPRTDVVFDHDGIRYVRPAPLLGGSANMFPGGRPRIKAEPKDSGVEHQSPRIVPKLSREQWNQLNQEGMILEGGSYEEWTSIQRSRVETSTPLAQVVAMPVDLGAFKSWCATEQQPPVLAQSLGEFATKKFNDSFADILRNRQEFVENGVRPRRYLLVCTEMIGQAESNDVSHILEAIEKGDEYPYVSEIITNMRVCLNEALCIAAAIAIQRGLDSVLWYENKSYAWV